MTTYPVKWPKCVFCDEFALDGHLTCGRHQCDESEARSFLEAKTRGEAISRKDYPSAEDWNKACSKFFDTHADCEIDPNTIIDDTKIDA